MKYMVISFSKEFCDAKDKEQYLDERKPICVVENGRYGFSFTHTVPWHGTKDCGPPVH